jgi:hypothetical protein
MTQIEMDVWQMNWIDSARIRALADSIRVNTLEYSRIWISITSVINM